MVTYRNSLHMLARLDAASAAYAVRPPPSRACHAASNGDARDFMKREMRAHFRG